MTETKKSTTDALRQKPAPPEARTLKTRTERYAAGKALRETCPRSSHADWKPPHDRPDPIRLVLKADEGRVPELLPCATGVWPCLPSPATGAQDPAVISRYLGKSDAFDKAIAAFSVAYADQNEKDHAVLKRAIRDGKIKALIEKAK
jgi:hypothetical protein